MHARFKLIIGRTAFSESILHGCKRNGSWRVLNRDCRKDKNELIQNADFCSKTWLASSRTLKDRVSRILVEISQPSDMCKLKTVKEGIQRVQSNMKMNLSPPPACCGLFSLILVPIFFNFLHHIFQYISSQDSFSFCNILHSQKSTGLGAHFYAFFLQPPCICFMFCF